jgi:hypothetical protein
MSTDTGDETFTLNCVTLTIGPEIFILAEDWDDRSCTGCIFFENREICEEVDFFCETGLAGIWIKPIIAKKWREN